MKNNEFLERIRVNSPSQDNAMELEEEEKAKKIIRDFDRTLQNKTYKNTRERSNLICHIRQNQYDKRTVVQASFLTVGCQMKRAGSCWNCNYGALDKCLITPSQYIKAFKKALSGIHR